MNLKTKCKMICKETLHSLYNYNSKTGMLVDKSTNEEIKTKHIYINYRTYPLHRLIYQYHYGDLNHDDKVLFKDKDKNNTKIENLYKSNNIKHTHPKINNNKKLPGVAKLRETFDYNFLTGELFNKITNTVENRTGGGCIYVYVNGVRFLAHRIIWKLVNGQYDEKKHISHKDGNQLNNIYTNLLLCDNHSSTKQK